MRVLASLKALIRIAQLLWDFGQDIPARWTSKNFRIQAEDGSVLLERDDLEGEAEVLGLEEALEEEARCSRLVRELSSKIRGLLDIKLPPGVA